MSAYAGVNRPGKAEGRADGREAGHLTPEVSRFPSSDTQEEAEPHVEADFEEETPGPLSTTRGRYDLRSGIARMLRPKDGGRGPAVCGCGFSAYGKDAVAVHLGGTGDKRKASVSGVYRCDSISACPVCTIRRAKEVEERLTEAAAACIGHGGSMCALTITVRRKRDQSLRELRQGTTAAFHRARQGSGWTKPSAAAGMLGLTTTTECPWSPWTGHGFHIHVLIFFDHRNRKAAVDHCKLLIRRYLAELAGQGLVGTREAQYIQVCGTGEKAAAYCAKAAKELAHGWAKGNRKEKSTSVHPFAVAARACLKDEEDNPLEVPGLEGVSPERAYHAFREYADVFSGIRQGVISAPLAKKLGLKGDKETPEEDAEQQLKNEAPVVGVVDSELWNRLMAKALAGTFLSKVETEITFDADTGDVVGWSEVIGWAEKATGVRLNHEATSATENRFARDREIRERTDHFVAEQGLEWRDALDAARVELREEFEAGLYGQGPRGPSDEEMATWLTIKRSPARITVGQVWDEAHKRAGGLLTHHGSGIGRVMSHVPDAISAIRARIEARGEEAALPSEAEVWVSVLEQIAA